MADGQQWELLLQPRPPAPGCLSHRTLFSPQLLAGQQQLLCSQYPLAVLVSSSAGLCGCAVGRELLFLADLGRLEGKPVRSF